MARAKPALLLAALLVLIPTVSTSAIVVQGLLTDVPDTVTGEDRWRATYYVVDWSGYDVDYGFSIRIPLDEPGYEQVDSAQGGGDWAVVLHTRDPQIPSDGALDARSLNATPGLAAPFFFEFVWGSGQGPAPLADEVVVYDDAFVVIDSGTVPEPGFGLGLTLGGLLLAGLAARRRPGRTREPAAEVAPRGAMRTGAALAGLLVLTSGGEVRAQVSHVVLVGDYGVSFSLKADQGQRVSQTETDYVIEATATNLGTDARPFQLIVTANSPTLAVVGGSLVFPGLAQYAMATAEGTVIRLDRQGFFDPAELVWNVEHAGDNTCVSDGDCASNHCQNGYCCPSGDCCGMQSDCDAYDEAPVCDDAASCQGTRVEGVCNGLSQCEAGVFDDDSGCLGEVSSSCDPYAAVSCSALVDQTAPSCGNLCFDSTDCAPVAVCLAGQCVFRLPAGSPCDSTPECMNGLACADGVCCTTACNGSCESCVLPGSEGVCTLVPPGQDPDDECGTVDCTGYYDGWSGNVCYGRADISANAATCDGTGSCADASTVCLSSGQGSATLTCQAVCQTPTSGTCVGTTPGTCTNLSLGDQTCGQGVCQVTEPICLNGFPNPCTPNFGAAGPESCNGVDDNCDGAVDNGAFQDSFEPDNGCSEVQTLAVVGSNQTIGYNTQTVYGAGDVDYYEIVAHETDSTCSCCDTFCLDEDFRLQITLTAPAGAGSYLLCTGSTCGSVNTNCTEVLAGQSGSWTWDVDGSCTANDTFSRFVRIVGSDPPAFQCAPYTLSYHLTPGCF